MTEKHEARWANLEALSELVRDSIDEPAIAFFDAKWSEFPEWYADLLGKLHALTKPDDAIIFLSAEAIEGAPIGRLIALREHSVIEVHLQGEPGDAKPVASVWSRRDLNQLSVEKVDHYALPADPPRGYSASWPAGLKVTLRYLGRDPIQLPFAGASTTCDETLGSLLPKFQDDIVATPPRLQ